MSAIRTEKRAVGNIYLIIDGPKVDIGFQWFAGDATCQHVLASVIEAVFNQDPRHVLHLKRVTAELDQREKYDKTCLRPAKCSSILELATQNTRLEISGERIV